MDVSPVEFGAPSRLRALLDHFAVIEDPRPSPRVAYPLAELLLLAVCGMIVDCDDYDAISAWGEDHLDGKTSRGSYDKASGQAPLHLVSAFATTSRLVLAQEAVPDKANELAAIPLLLDRLAAEGGLDGALVTIDAIACNATVAKAVRDAGADYLLAVKANQPTLRRKMTGWDTTILNQILAGQSNQPGFGALRPQAVSLVRQTAVPAAA